MKFQGNLYQWLVLPLAALVYYKFTTRFFFILDFITPLIYPKF